jgi:hypothetical protein
VEEDFKIYFLNFSHSIFEEGNFNFAICWQKNFTSYMRQQKTEIVVHGKPPYSKLILRKTIFLQKITKRVLRLLAAEPSALSQDIWFGK